MHPIYIVQELALPPADNTADTAPTIFSAVVYRAEMYIEYSKTFI